MTADNGHGPQARKPDAPAQRKSPARVDSSTRVNVVFPFAQLRIHEPSGQLTQLAALVADLAEVLATAAPGPEAEALRQRAHDLTGQVR